MRHRPSLAYLAHRAFLFLTFISASRLDGTSFYSDLEALPSNSLSAEARCSSEVPSNKKLVCYYRVEDEFRPYDLNPCLCTHVIYSYVAVKENFAFIAGKKGDLKYLSALRARNPALKIVVSLRPTGTLFTLEDPQNITYPFSSTNTLRHRFAKRIRDFLYRHGLDGVDIDYEYFKIDQHSNNRKRQYLISIIQSISESLRSNETNRILLTLTTSRYPRHLADYYDFAEIHKYADFVNIPAFNFDQEGKTLVHPAKLHGLSEMENMDAIIDLAYALGLPSHQLVVGVPTFGTLYRLANLSQTTPGAPSISWSENSQPITTISHSKICDVRDKTNWTVVREKDLTAPYIFNNDKWIGFDDEISIKLKAKYVLLRKCAGLAFFHLNDDDPAGQCGLGPYPLVQSALSVFSQATEDVNLISHPMAPLGNLSQYYFTSFLNIVEKHGNVERVTDEEDEANSVDTLSCTHSGYMRHSEDCTRFYRCLKFSNNDADIQKFQYNCPPGLVFDENYQICNWPSWSPTCIGSGEIALSTKQSFICRKVGYYQDPNNCEYFHYCSDLGKTHLQSYEFKCPFELGFDEENMQCNWKWLIKGCQYVPPEERVVKDLQQILPQDVTGGEKDLLSPAASDLTAMFEHLSEPAMAEGEEDTFEDEFEERSDGGQKPVIRRWRMLKQLQDRLVSLQQMYGSKWDQMSSDGQPNGSKLQTLSNYMVMLMSRLRDTIWPNTLQSRADRTNSRTNSGNWLNPFNHLIPKLPRPFRKTKTGESKKSKSISQSKNTRIKSKKSIAFSKNPFKMPKLPKLSKKKRNGGSKSENKARLTQQNAEIPRMSQMMSSQVMPMFIEESVHVPQFIKAPAHFSQSMSHHRQLSSGPFGGIMSSESSIKPVFVASNKPQSNHFNGHKHSPHFARPLNSNVHSHVNVLNDYQVASSFAINTFGDQQQSTVAKETYRFVPTKAPLHESPYPKSSKPKPVTKPKSNGPSAGSVPFKHSYGLPSVNIRYTYNENKQNKPKPLQHQVPQKPKQQINNKLAPVRIEATKYNFPDRIVNSESDSADTQLENFLRDKFINNDNSKQVKPTNMEQVQPSVYRQKPKVPKPSRVTHPKSVPVQMPPLTLSHDRMPLAPDQAPSSSQHLPRTENKFSTFISDPFALERQKFFSQFSPLKPSRRPEVSTLAPVPTLSYPKVKLSHVPKSGGISYKLTPITDSIFEINNHSSVNHEPAHVIERPIMHEAIGQQDPISHAIHKANRFEYIRSTPKPAIQYESYEWTTPTSIKNDKLNINFNLMTQADIRDQIDKKRYLFGNNGPYRPVDTPLNLDKHQFFPSLGNVFSNFGQAVPDQNKHLLGEYQPGVSSESSAAEDVQPTTQSPWTSDKPVDEQLSALLNDTNEYIMLMLNKATPEKILDQHLQSLLDSSKQFGKIYNVENNGAQTLLALLPNSANRPFVYKGESSLLKNFSDTKLVNPSSLQSPDVLNLDISQPDSEILHSIFDKVKDELHGTDKLLPSHKERLHLLDLHQSRRIPPSSDNVFNAPLLPARTTTTSRPSTVRASSPLPDSYPPGHYDYELLTENQPLHKLNRSSNAWYDDVNKQPIHYDTLPNYELAKQASTEPPYIDLLPSTRYYPRPTSKVPVTTTTSTTTTTTTTTTTEAPLPSQAPSKRPKRPPLRRKPEFGNRQRQRPNKPKVEEEVVVSSTQSTQPTHVDYSNQNNFGQKLNGQQSFAEVSSTEKPFFYEEELPDFSELNYPETQNHHHAMRTSEQSSTSSVASSTTASPVAVVENTYYPDSTIHNLKADKSGIPESACTRPGIFQHPNDCNKYYECYWDKRINKFSLQPFECPVKLAFDSRIIGCGSPNDPTVCVQY